MTKIPDVLTEYLTGLFSEQENHKEETGKYKQIQRTVLDEYEIEVHEYQCNNGEVGYQAFICKKIDGKEYIKSLGEGPEKSARDFDWIEINNEIL